MAAQALHDHTRVRTIAQIRHAFPIGDGRRFVVFHRAGAPRLTLLDASTGVERNVARGCDATAAQPGVFLLACGYHGHAALLFARRSRLAFPIGVRPGDRYTAMGRYWIAGSRPGSGVQQCPADQSCGYAPGPDVFVNWRTGERRTCDPSTAACDFDLDRPGLPAAASAPARHRPHACVERVGAGRVVWTDRATHHRWLTRLPGPPDACLHTAHRLFVGVRGALLELAPPA